MYKFIKIWVQCENNNKFVDVQYSITMLLSKETAIKLNLTHCKLKQYIASMLKKRGVPLTPEQFILIDLLWNQGPMSQQQLADQMLAAKCDRCVE